MISNEKIEDAEGNCVCEIFFPSQEAIEIKGREADMCVKDIYLSGRKDALDEVYTHALNDNFDGFIEWLQDNLID